MELNRNVRENMLLLAFVVSTIKATVLRKPSLEFNAVNSPKNLSDLDFQNKLIILKFGETQSSFDGKFYQEKFQG